MNAKLSDADISGAIKVLTSEESAVIPSSESLEILQTKHPKQQEDCYHPPGPIVNLPVPKMTPDEVHPAVVSFPSGASGGMFGLKPQHKRSYGPTKTTIRERFM